MNIYYIVTDRMQATHQIILQFNVENTTGLVDSILNIRLDSPLTGSMAQFYSYMTH